LVLPFCPGVLYAQLIAYSSTWRWIGVLVGGWSLIGVVLTAFFYWPPPRNQYQPRRELLRRIDWVGGFLSATGLCLLLIGLALPTSGYTWTDVNTLVTLILGIVLLIVFTVWEWRFAKYPMFSARLKEKNPRVLFIILLITFISGANFFAVLVYWPTQYQNVYADDNPISIGIGSLPVSFGLIVGSILVSILVSVLKGKIRTLLICTTIIMVAGNGAMAAGTRDNITLLWVIVTIAALGVGANIVPIQIIAGIIVPDELIATITAATITIRIVGGCIGYAVYSNIFASTFADQAATRIVPLLAQIGIKDDAAVTQIVDVIRGGGFALLEEIPGITNKMVEELTTAGKEALVNSYPVVYYASIGFGGICIIASCFLTGISEQMQGGAAVRLD
jgi:hypothetical protein